MTDRLRTVTVVLDRDYRDDDAEPILAALRMVRGVAAVEWRALTSTVHVDREVAAREMRQVFYEVLRLYSFSGDADKLKRLKELLGVP